MIRYAGLLALRLDGDWLGVLIEGPSGSGKSDLALRALDAGWSLVADDRTLVWTCGGRLYGRAPEALTGLIEARGLGVMPTSHRTFAEIGLIARCAPGKDIERLPDPSAEALLGVRLPRLDLAPLEPSSPAKLRRALTHLGLRR